MQEILKLGTREVRFGSDCEQLIKLLKEEEDWPAMAPELDEIKALSADLSTSLLHISRDR